MFQQIILIWWKSKFVYPHWGRISIYRQLSYPLRSLWLPVSSFLDSFFIFHPSHHFSKGVILSIINVDVHQFIVHCLIPEDPFFQLPRQFLYISPISPLLQKGCFVYHQWWCTSIYRLLSHPQRSLCLPVSSFLDNFFIFYPSHHFYRRGYFIYHQWGHISIYQPLSYPLRSLCLPVSSFLHSFFIFHPSHHFLPLSIQQILGSFPQKCLLCTELPLPLPLSFFIFHPSHYFLPLSSKRASVAHNL